MNRALRRISIAVLVMFVLLLINVNYLQGFDTASLASKPGNSRAFYAAQNQYQRGSIVTSDGKVIAASRLSSGNDSIKYQRYYPSGPEYAPVTGYYTIFGATGIEAAKNSLLSGNDSSLDVRKIIDLITGKTTKGATVQVTVNSKAQDAAWNALKALGKPGAVVAIDSRSRRAVSWRSVMVRTTTIARPAAIAVQADPSAITRSALRICSSVVSPEAVMRTTPPSR